MYSWFSIVSNSYKLFKNLNKKSFVNFDPADFYWNCWNKNGRKITIGLNIEW